MRADARLHHLGVPPVIDAAEDTENGEDALAQIVVLGMITKRKRGTRGHTVRPRCAAARCGLWLMGVVP